MRVSQFVDQLSQQQLLLLRALVEEVKHVPQHLLTHLLCRVMCRSLWVYIGWEGGGRVGEGDSVYTCGCISGGGA